MEKRESVIVNKDGELESRRLNLEDKELAIDILNDAAAQAQRDQQQRYVALQRKAEDLEAIEKVRQALGADKTNAAETAEITKQKMALQEELAGVKEANVETGDGMQNIEEVRYELQQRSKALEENTIGAILNLKQPILDITSTLEIRKSQTGDFDVIDNNSYFMLADLYNKIDYTMNNGLPFDTHAELTEEEMSRREEIAARLIEEIIRVFDNIVIQASDHWRGMMTGQANVQNLYDLTLCFGVLEKNIDKMKSGLNYTGNKFSENLFSDLESVRYKMQEYMNFFEVKADTYQRHLYS